MASIINASTSSGLVTTADTSGILQLQSNGTTIATISSTGLSTQVGAPAFSAYKSSSTNQTNGVVTAVVFDTEQWDTANCYNNSTGIFTPNVAGYYQLNACIDSLNDASLTQAFVVLYKNGSVFKYGAMGNTKLTNATFSGTVYANGTTDYFQIYYQEYGGVGAYGGTGVNSAWTWFDGYMVRSA